jgi:hypothetical protein
MDIE